MRFLVYPHPKNSALRLNFFGLPTRGRRAREVNIAAKLAPMREGGPPRWSHIERRRIGAIFFEEMRKGSRLENLGGPPEFTLRPAFAGPVARAMTIFWLERGESHNGLSPDSPPCPRGWQRAVVGWGPQCEMC